VKFGKYAGTKMVDVPLSYWSWAVAKMDLLNPESSAYDLDFAASVEVALEEIANKSHS
jgi:hypothetical protein